jgi:hypothetical protein
VVESWQGPPLGHSLPHTLLIPCIAQGVTLLGICWLTNLADVPGLGYVCGGALLLAPCTT